MEEWIFQAVFFATAAWKILLLTRCFFPLPAVYLNIFMMDERMRAVTRTREARRHARKRWTMEALANKKCVPCKAGTPPLDEPQIQPLLSQLNGWTVEDNRRLVKSLTFGDFKTALDFVNRVGEIAEAEGHHPDISFGWGKAVITLSTHRIRGLSENDFIMAAKIDALERP